MSNSIKKAGKLIHPNGIHSVQVCKCGTVVIQIGSTFVRMPQNEYLQFANTIGCSFEKFWEQPSKYLGMNHHPEDLFTQHLEDNSEPTPKTNTDNADSLLH